MYRSSWKITARVICNNRTLANILRRYRVRDIDERRIG